MQEHRKLKRYTISGRPTIMLRGNRLEECGFSEDMPIEVICEKGKLTIIPRDPDPIPEPVQKASDLIWSLTPNQRWILEKSLQEHSR